MLARYRRYFSKEKTTPSKEPEKNKEDMMENKGFDFTELEKTLDALKNKLTDLEKKIDGMKDKVEETRERPSEKEQEEERAERRAEREAERAERIAEREAERGPGTRFGPGFPFDTDFPAAVRGAVEGAFESMRPIRESQRTTKDFKISDFTGIQIGGAFEVEVVRADTYSISVTAEDELFRNLDVSREGDTLRIRHSRHIGWRAQLTRPRAKITLPLLKELRLSGASRGTISGFNSSENFRLEISGASALNGDITAGNAELEVSGASRARLTGSAQNVLLETSGASHMELGGFSVHDAAVRASGASHTVLKIDGKLDARLSGASHLSYIGNPMMGNIRTSGGARLSRE